MSFRFTRKPLGRHRSSTFLYCNSPYHGEEASEPAEEPFFRGFVVLLRFVMSCMTIFLFVEIPQFSSHNCGHDIKVNTKETRFKKTKQKNTTKYRVKFHCHLNVVHLQVKGKTCSIINVI